MKLIDACKDILGQLSDVIKNIQSEDFTRQVPTLNNSTVGQHIRHTLEFFTCLMNNHTTGRINYDQRDHDKVIETDQLIAQAVIEDLTGFLDNSAEDKSLVLEANYAFCDESITELNTNLHRELAYNIEHAIHHMAIIKIGLKEVAPYLEIPSHFGVAVSTIKYQKQLSSS